MSMFYKSNARVLSIKDATITVVLRIVRYDTQPPSPSFPWKRESLTL